MDKKNNPLFTKPPKKEKTFRTAEEIAKEQAPTPQQVKSDLEKAREVAFASYSEYLKLLTSKDLDQNKTIEQKHQERMIVETMYQRAFALDLVNQGEGSMSLALMSARAILQLKDKMNEFDFRLAEIEKLLKRSLEKKTNE